VISTDREGASVLRRKSERRDIIVFLLIAFGGSWSLWGVAWLLGVLTTGITGQIVVAFGACAPALATFVVHRWVTRDGFADTGLHPHLRRAWPYYLVAWLLPLPVVGVIVGLATGLGLPLAKPGLPPELVAATVVGALVSSPLFFGEEFGWRGYLQGRLFGGRRPLPAALLTGLVWGVFHYPVILVGFEGYENPMVGLAIFPVFTMLLSVIFGWLRRRTGSVWCTCLGHAAANGSGGALTAYLFLAGGRFILTSYAGVLGWLPLGAICAWIIVTRQLAPVRPRPSIGHVVG
jgi:membrane protease YdiL (CAAX protease family)